MNVSQTQIILTKYRKIEYSLNYNFGRVAICWKMDNWQTDYKRVLNV